MSFTSPMPEAVRAERPQPEQTFFADPALDRAFGVVMALATEVWVMRDHATSRGAEAPSAILEPARQAARRAS